ncbi:hypothetical protein N9168_06810, partial [Akkermansiaceae bacterium]|nr:hypothetical protein [Akkermansiaceae bacterium]
RLRLIFFSGPNATSTLSRRKQFPSSHPLRGLPLHPAMNLVPVSEQALPRKAITPRQTQFKARPAHSKRNFIGSS